MKDEVANGRVFMKHETRRGKSIRFRKGNARNLGLDQDFDFE
jgi:hypothetical protein